MKGGEVAVKGDWEAEERAGEGAEIEGERGFVETEGGGMNERIRREKKITW